MPLFTHGEVSIYYEEYGAGFPLLTFAPGSLSSSIDWWRGASAPIDPTQAFADRHRVIAMDQRNAGRSRAPISAQDGWHSYVADHLGLLDHLGVEQALLYGQCIGGPFIMALLQAAPQRFPAVVVAQPIGRVAPELAHSTAFDRWAETLKDHPEATPAVLTAFHNNLYRDGFVFSVSKEFASQCSTPMLVLAGNDQAHPFAIAEELARLAPNAEFIPDWKDGPAREQALGRIRSFLAEHTPA